MSWPLLIIIQMAIGAFIGGMTNELAIRMLFRPYKPIYIGKWRVPFTPGLIPKRHEELAHQMGKLVENFLITPEGVRNMIQKGHMRPGRNPLAPYRKFLMNLPECLRGS